MAKMGHLAVGNLVVGCLPDEKEHLLEEFCITTVFSKYNIEKNAYMEKVDNAVESRVDPCKNNTELGLNK